MVSEPGFGAFHIDEIWKLCKGKNVAFSCVFSLDSDSSLSWGLYSSRHLDTKYIGNELDAIVCHVI